MKKFIALSLLVLAPAFTQASGPGQRRLLVGFADETGLAERMEALTRIGARPIEDIAELGITVAQIPVGTFTTMADMAAKAGPAVTAIEEDVTIQWLSGSGPRRAPALPGLDEVLSAVPGLSPLVPGPKEVPWGVARVNAPAAWAKTRGQSVRVAILDTGIDSTHPDLAGKVVECYNALDKKASCADDNGHGTHVAGTIAAAVDLKGVAGVAPGASLVAVKVLDGDGSSSLTSVIKGIIWCGNHNIQVANMSLGAPTGFIFLRAAVMYAKAKGVVLVAAAGNSGKAVEYPAGYPDVIAVSAGDPKDRIADFSSRGTKVEFIAPGTDILSTVPGGRWEAWDGTSMATPHVAGLAALAVSRGHQGVAAVRSALTSAARPLPGLTSSEQGRGLINASLIK